MMQGLASSGVDDANAIARETSALIHDPVLRLAMGDANTKKVQTRTVSNVAKAHAEVFETIRDANECR